MSQKIETFNSLQAQSRDRLAGAILGIITLVLASCGLASIIFHSENIPQLPKK